MEEKTTIDVQIADAAEYLDKLESSIKTKLKDLRDQRNDAREHLKKLICEKRDGQMTIPLTKAMA